MKKIIAIATAATLAAPTLASAGGLDPVIIDTTPVAPVVVAGPTGSLGGATPWIVAGLALGLVALAASDGT